ncbi:MAG TPA: polyprenyl diphosphate synthase, partial [Solirubrobacteraceae bacterium]|nr:polyprenyl diphosphate synthase [Solirubrobacteraceae bacterium]
ARTAANSGLRLQIAMSYGGRWDIVQAAQQLASECASGALRAQDVSEASLAARLALAGLPEPDLMIRTGGEQRLSNFLLWDLAYAELYFTARLWPEFTVSDLAAALEFFAGRERRFGITGAQRPAAKA